MKDYPLNLGTLTRATFRERPNRFVISCNTEEGEIEAHLPNPGRLWELLLPGATLYLSSNKAPDSRQKVQRKTGYTAVAVERKGSPIFLHTHLTNQVARYLIEARSIPSLEQAEIVREEVPYGRSRFDFLLNDHGGDLYLEVKSCTLFGNGVAMFPDAVTERGRKHLLELAQMARKGVNTMILFIVHYPHVNWFMPDFHTDYAFSSALLEARHEARVMPVAIDWKPDLSISEQVKILEVPWSYLEGEVADRGSYLLVLGFDRDKAVQAGRLGTMLFRKGYYIYVGSAMTNLTARIERHKRMRKKEYWHVDYLTHAADSLLALPIRSSRREECGIAKALSSILAHGPAGFGSSDCGCKTHLFRSKDNPLHAEAFHDVLQSFRMRHP
ncbi:MAG: DNA/RNA nuclease SfsA [Deltaproteobacteria bacterium]|nr:MAG: DNA/RNA nuclease SfsA [Deltaproteobacteria bacterium]